MAEPNNSLAEESPALPVTATPPQQRGRRSRRTTGELNARTVEYPGLNGMRAVGALMVVTTHTAFNTGQITHGWGGAILARMDFGVTIFFVLSGFLLSRPYLLRAAADRPRPRVGHYLWKRALRILPLYWVTVAVVWLWDPANKGTITFAMWVRNLTLTQLYAPQLLPHGLTQMWSLATEAVFYLALPALMLLLLGRRGFSERRVLILLGFLFVFGLCWQAWAVSRPGSEGHQAQWLPGYLPWFGCGIMLATLSVGDTLKQRVHLLHRIAEDPGGCWLVAALLYGIACTPVAGPRDLAQMTGWDAVIKFTLYAFSATLLILPLVFGPADQGRIRALCRHRIPYFLGEISYGSFCLHLVFLDALIDSLGIGTFHGHFLELWTYTVACTLAAATVAYYWVERPMLRLKDVGRFSKPPKPKRRASAEAI